MDTSMNAEQVEHMLSHLARLRHRGDRADIDVLENLKPAWLRADAWDILLEDLKAQRYRERAHGVRLRLIAR